VTDPTNNATWCATGDVLTLTGVTVTDTQLLQAGATIDVACGRPYEIDGDPTLNRIGSRDRYWLKLATAWQAAWITSQPDAFQRTDALAVQAGRRMITLRDTALFLSVNARKALKRVSWLKSRAIHVRSPFQDGVGAGLLGMDPDSSAADSIYPWSSAG
jgi:hypothetical protein